MCVDITKGSLQTKGFLVDYMGFEKTFYFSAKEVIRLYDDWYEGPKKPRELGFLWWMDMNTTKKEDEKKDEAGGEHVQGVWGDGGKQTEKPQ